MDNLTFSDVIILVIISVLFILGMLRAARVSWIEKWVPAWMHDEDSPLPVKKLHIRRSDAVKGPFSIEELRLLFDVGGIDAETPCRYQDAENWVPYEQVAAAASKLMESWTHTVTPKRPDFFSHAAGAAWMAFMLLCFFSIFDMDGQHLRSKQRLNLSYRETLPPENLPRAAEMFRWRLAAQDPTFSADKVTSFPAWADLQQALSTYSERLKLLETQNEERDEYLQQRSLWVSRASLVAIIAYWLFSAISRNRNRSKPPFARRPLVEMPA